MSSRSIAKRRNKVRSSSITGRNTPELGRTRVRVADSLRRAPLRASTSKSTKVAGRHFLPAEIPAYIRASGPMVDDADRDYLRRKLGRRLGKFAHALQRVSVRLEDINGPHGGIDKCCRIKVALTGQPSVVISSSSSSMQGAMDEALARTEHAVRQSLKRRQTAMRGRVKR
jgi:ribosome-associated translation inhibitor RaiA